VGKSIELTVNGVKQEVEVDPESSLLDVLRDRLGLVGVRRACDSGGCGNCTVLVDDRAVYSCMMFGVSAQEKTVTTVEGLGSNGELDPLQEAFLDQSAVQCGYCTSGMLMSGQDFLNRTSEDNPSEEDVRDAISGVLCRCTGYQKIVEAIKQAAINKGGENNNE
jgi:carbon-monoxide dehydrogenase small subunit